MVEYIVEYGMGVELRVCPPQMHDLPSRDAACSTDVVLFFIRLKKAHLDKSTVVDSGMPNDDCRATS